MKQYLRIESALSACDDSIDILSIGHERTHSKSIVDDHTTISERHNHRGCKYNIREVNVKVNVKVKVKVNTEFLVVSMIMCGLPAWPH